MASNIHIPTDLSDEIIVFNFFKQLLAIIEEMQTEIDSLKSV